MTIEILPAQLANQIAAGEVVERPASVVKELVENSLDAGATSIRIDIEKGGAKRIRIADNGHGIVKEELSLALSRHATSKVKNLTDLEGISSLGFRGEALASISSVARLTLTSKTELQQQAWQACAQGRDMDVTVQPAAHPNGTTIDVVDLFFNTPARRKFLRTDKTEFAHIDEVIKRMGLVHFNVAFVLTHNGSIVRNYPLAIKDQQQQQRVAKICGQGFVDNALKVHCQHDGLQLSGWIAQPNYYRKQNDLCYSYVNGRMMRDKLINHAIRQAFNELLSNDVYPAFVLFLQLDCRDVDVNVHPAKHEVRFHQGRYVHDFIYSVCQQALVDNQGSSAVLYDQQIGNTADVQKQVNSFIKPLSQASEVGDNREQALQYSNDAIKTRADSHSQKYASPSIASSSLSAYQQLLSPTVAEQQARQSQSTNQSDNQPNIASEKSIEHALDCTAEVDPEKQAKLHFIAPHYSALWLDQELHLISLNHWQIKLNKEKMRTLWQKPLVSQPLLLPLKIKISIAQMDFVAQHLSQFEKLGMVVQLSTPNYLQVRQFPALLRHCDVSSSIMTLITQLIDCKVANSLDESHWQNAFVLLMSDKEHNETSSQELWQRMLNTYPMTIKTELRLNSAKVDLTSTIEKLN